MTTSSTTRLRPRTARLLVATALLAGAATTTTVLRAVSADAPATPATFVAITPCRLLDTRPGSINVGQRATPIGAGETHTVAGRGESGNCLVPDTATALSMNVVAIGPTAASYLTVFPAGVTRPTASSLNWVAGQAPTPNAVTSALGTDGGLSLFNLAGTVDLAVDVVGYFVAAPTPATGPAGPQGSAGPAGPAGESANPPRIVHVAASGGQFTTVAAALASITDASSTNRYVVRIGPGVFDAASSSTMKDWVDLEGAGRGATVLRSSDEAGTIVVGTARTVLSDLTVIGTGGLAIDATSASPRVFELRRVAIEVSGTGATVGVVSDQQLVVDDLDVEVSSTDAVRAVDVVGGSATITGLDVLVVAGVGCRGLSVADASVTLEVAHVQVTGCEMSIGLLGLTADVTARDVRVSADSPSQSVGVHMTDSALFASSLRMSTSGGSTSHGLVTLSGSAFVSGGDIRSSQVAIDASATDVHVTDSVLSGFTSGLSGACTNVLAADLSTYTCS